MQIEGTCFPNEMEEGKQASNQQRHEHNNTFEDIFQNDNSLSDVNVYQQPLSRVILYMADT